MQTDRPLLQREHTNEVIARRLSAAKSHSYLEDFVLGSVGGVASTRFPTLSRAEY